MSSCKNADDKFYTSSFKDSVLKAHVLYVDSLINLGGFYSLDSNDYNYKVLKAYYLNDSNYLRLLVTNIENDRKNSIYETKYVNRIVPDIFKMKIDEGYQFQYSETFCSSQYIITISRDSSTYNLNAIVYKLAKANNDSVFLRVSQNTNKKLELKQWEEFIQLFSLADFWNLKQRDEAIVLDPSYLSVRGVEKFNQMEIRHANSVDRVIFRKTALYKAFRTLTDLSGINKVCNE